MAAQIVVRGLVDQILQALLARSDHEGRYSIDGHGNHRDPCRGKYRPGCGRGRQNDGPIQKAGSHWSNRIACAKGFQAARHFRVLRRKASLIVDNDGWSFFLHGHAPRSPAAWPEKIRPPWKDSRGQECLGRWPWSVFSSETA